MIIDTSALVSIFFGEPEQETFVRTIHAAEDCRISVVNHLELFMVIEHRGGAEQSRQVDHFLDRARISIEPVTLEQGQIARQAFLDFGKGRHPAGLNFGDCFAYALARISDRPLLYKGQDFARTDIAASVS
ncbi:MAG: type II toxin-antitoxin system VapC family toxin [Wenzhouxiangellaceae bacterium]